MSSPPSSLFVAHPLPQPTVARLELVPPASPEAMSAAHCRVVVLTFNCEGIIAETLSQARKLNSRPLVVDSYSTDRTAEIARSMGCEVVQRPFENYAVQRNWAIAALQGQCVWQLHLDADEVLDDHAVEEIARVVAAERTPHDAYMLRRIDYFMGRKLRYSGLNPWHLRLFRDRKAHCENRLYDQHFVASVPAGRLQGFMHDKNSLNLSDWTVRHNRWSDLEVAELMRREHDASGVLRADLMGDPRERTRSLKKLYYRLPGGMRSVAYFGYRYVFRLGFLDGREGFYFALLQAFWFRLLVDAKSHESRRSTLSQQPEAEP